jgi:ABC-type glycerol-3-phosphate transport system substrate-binding protein
MRNGVVRDLTPLIEKDPDFDLSDYFDSALSFARQDGALYAIPWDFTPMVMWYNKEFFDEELLQIPLPAALAAPLAYAGQDPYRDLRGTPLPVPRELADALGTRGIEPAPGTRLAVELAEFDPDGTTVSAWRWGFRHDGRNYTVRRKVAADGSETAVLFLDEGTAPYPRWGWTWDEFLETCRAVAVFPKGYGPDRDLPLVYAITFENLVPFWTPWIWTSGGDVLNPEGNRATGYLDGPESVEAMEFLTDLFFRFHFAPTLPERERIGQDPFLNAQAAMDLKGHWMMIDYRTRRFDVGITTIPTNGIPPVTVIFPVGLAITTKAAHPDLAWDFIKHFTRADVQARRMAQGIAVSGNRRAAERFADDPLEQAFLRATAIARPPWGVVVEDYAFVEDLLREMMESVHYQRRDVAAALRDTARLIDAALDK